MRIIRNGRNKFNAKPKDVSNNQFVFLFYLLCVRPQGIKFLQSNNILGESARDIAEYLMKGELLNKRAIGDYLGEG